MRTSGDAQASGLDNQVDGGTCDRLTVGFVFVLKAL